MMRRYLVKLILGAASLFLLAALTGAIYCHSWDSAMIWATLLVGLITACVIVWQGYLIKQQIAFSTYLELDREWNSVEMIKARQAVHKPRSKTWDLSRLEGILEFFEKLASMFNLSGDMPFIYQSTLGWYAARYFLFAREHDQIATLRELWQDHVYGDLEELYHSYLISEVGCKLAAQRSWEAKCLATEEKFWEQERKD